MTGRRVVRDHEVFAAYGEGGVFDPAPAHEHAEYVAGCWACGWTHRCLSCNDLAVEGAYCVKHERGRVA